MGTPEDSKKTRQKIINAAGQLFSQKGFSAITVRDIAQKAETQISAINYHFHTKDELYREVVKDACRSDSITDDDKKALLALPPEEALFIIVRESLELYWAPSSLSWKKNIINRETSEPGDVFKEMLTLYYKPETEFIASIISNIVAKPSDSSSVQFAVISLFGLIDSFGSYRELVNGTAPGFFEKTAKNDWLARQITEQVIKSAHVQEAL